MKNPRGVKCNNTQCHTIFLYKQKKIFVSKPPTSSDPSSFFQFIMQWNKVLNNWSRGLYPKFTQQTKGPFIWQTSVLDSKEQNPYREKIMIKNFVHAAEDRSPFNLQINKKTNSEELYAIGFWNLSKDAYLVIPKPRSGKNFQSLFHFCKNASKLQLRKFWKRVVIEIRNMLKQYPTLYVNVQGSAVAYLHVRLDTKPKYYKGNWFK